MTQVRARVRCCRPDCEESCEYFADISVSLRLEHDTFGSTETPEICMSPPGGGWVADGGSIYGGDRYVCPTCSASERRRRR